MDHMDAMIDAMVDAEIEAAQLERIVTAGETQTCNDPNGCGACNFCLTALLYANEGAEESCQDCGVLPCYGDEESCEKCLVLTS